MTLGFEVFVQLVIAATTTAPCSRPSIPGTMTSVATAAAAGCAPAAVSPGFDEGGFALRSVSIRSSACWNRYFDCRSETRSCGRFGPARLGSIVDRLSSIVDV
jgi:hypothetical protein